MKPTCVDCGRPVVKGPRCHRCSRLAMWDAGVYGKRRMDPAKLVCPQCGGSKTPYALACRTCTNGGSLPALPRGMRLMSLEDAKEAQSLMRVITGAAVGR